MDIKIPEQELDIDISLLNDLSKESPTEFLKMLMDKIVIENQTLSDIKIPSLIENQYNKTINDFEYYEICSKGSSFLQNIISNNIRTDLKLYENNKIL